MNELFEAQINALPDQRTPASLFFMVEYAVRKHLEIKSVEYNSGDEVVIVDGLTFDRMDGMLPVFRSNEA